MLTAALDSVLRVRLDSALRVERSKGIFIDTTTKGLRGDRDLPLMIFSRPQLSRLNRDTSGRWQHVGDSTYALIDGSQLYRVGVTDSVGTVWLRDPYYAAARTRILGSSNAAMAMTTAPDFRLEALETPRADEFPAPALTLPMRDGRSTLADYVQTRLWREGWPWNEDVQQARDSTVVRFITKYIEEPSGRDGRRFRRVSYLISVSDSTRGTCRRISVRWKTQSKGLREATWATLRADSVYEPSSRNIVRGWFANLEPCRR